MISYVIGELVTSTEPALLDLDGVQARSGNRNSGTGSQSAGPALS